RMLTSLASSVFFFPHPSSTVLDPLSLHDALPISHCWRCKNPLIYKGVSSWFISVSQFRDRMVELNEQITWVPEHIKHGQFGKWRSEEHTSELQSRFDLVCRLLLEKKKKNK